MATTQAEILQDELLGFLRESPSVASLVSSNQVDRNNPCKSLGSFVKTLNAFDFCLIQVNCHVQNKPKLSHLLSDLQDLDLFVKLIN